MKRRAILACSAAAALAVLTAGCGGDGGTSGGTSVERLSTAAYLSQLNAICRAGEAEGEELGQAGGTLKELFSSDEIAAIFADRAEQTRSLSPPEELADAHARFVESVEEQTRVVRDASEAAKAGDDETLAAKVGELDDLDGRANEIAQEIGAEDCA